MFWYTTAVILVSSGLLQWGYFAAKNNEPNKLVVLITTTLMLGLVFLIGQWYSWVQLVEMETM